MGEKRGEKKDKEVRVFYEDLTIAQALLNKDKIVTTEFYFKGCFPIFQSLCNRFYTDCESPKELMDEVYMIMLYPSKKTGKCQLENFRGESTLRSWIKTLCLYYCYKKFKEKPPVVSLSSSSLGTNIGSGDRNNEKIASLQEGISEIDTTNMIKDDILQLISLMPNKRYAEVIRLYKIQGCSNTEVANALGVNMSNLYNLHLRAENQFQTVLREEESHV